MQIDDFLDVACKAISDKHSYVEQLAKQLLPIKKLISPNSAEQIVVSSQKQKLSGVISGVDSGFVSKKLSFVDVALIRTAGVIFNYKNGELDKADYFPSAFSFPEPIMLKSGLEKDEEQQSLSFERLKQEIGLSIKIIEKFKPRFAFIDGSIVPQYQDKPRKESELNNDYSGIISLFQKLYSAAEKNDCTLIACVEDSRGNRFRQLLQEEVLPVAKLKEPSLRTLSPETLDGSFDASLLDYFLAEGERTFAFPYTKNIENHAILKDYNQEWSKSIFVFYLKVSNFDKPLRVEFICKPAGASDSKSHEKLKACADEISSVVFSLSALHKEYSYPSVLIEADLRARLNEEDISVVYDRLIDKLGPKIRMRRNNRPFG